jgi:hypothetical protein
MAAAARAAELGAAVTVVEKAEHLGGSAALSAGIVFSAPDIDAYRRLCPDGDPELGRVLVQGFDAAVADVERAGVKVSERWSQHLGFAVAHWIDVSGVLGVWRDRVEAGAGRILRGCGARASS